jgi:hypothetical protein
MRTLGFKLILKLNLLIINDFVLCFRYYVVNWLYYELCMLTPCCLHKMIHGAFFFAGFYRFTVLTIPGLYVNDF